MSWNIFTYINLNVWNSLREMKTDIIRYDFLPISITLTLHNQI